jgi:hypothetical protein
VPGDEPPVPADPPLEAVDPDEPVEAGEPPLTDALEEVELELELEEVDAAVVEALPSFGWANGSRAWPLGCVSEGELLTFTAATGVPETGPWTTGNGAGACACLLSTTGTATIAAIRASGTGQSLR